MVDNTRHGAEYTPDPVRWLERDKGDAEKRFAEVGNDVDGSFENCLNDMVRKGCIYCIQTIHSHISTTIHIYSAE